MPRKLPPPAHLSPRAAELWAAIVPRRGRSVERLALLTVALEALDRADLARAAIERDGLTTTTARSGAIHAHPAIAIESAARREFARLWRALSLTWDADLDGRVG